MGKFWLWLFNIFRLWYFTNSVGRATYPQTFTAKVIICYKIYIIAITFLLLLLISMLWHRPAIIESKADKLSSSAEPGSLKTPIRKQIECPLNRLNYRGSSLKLELNSPSPWWVSIQPTWLHCRLAFAPGSGDMFVVVNFDALAQASEILI